MEEEVILRKILIHLPQDKLDVFKLMPFLYAVENEYKGMEIYIITSEEGKGILSLYPNRLNIHVISEDDYKNPARIHKYCINELTLFNMDIGYALDGWKSALTCFNIRTEIRIGEYSLKSRAFLNQVKKIDSDIHPLKKALELLCLHLKESIDMPIVRGKDFENEDENFGKIPIIAVELDHENIEDPEFIQVLKDMFEMYEGVKFIFYSEDTFEYDFADFVKDFSKENFYINKIVPNPEIDQSFHYDNLSRDLTYVNGVLCHSLFSVYLCSFLETPFIYRGETISAADEPLHFMGKGEFTSRSADIGKIVDRSLELFQIS